MQDFVNQLLPSFESLGIWGYWVLGFMVFLQGFAPTSAISPASAFVVLAGGLAAHGIYDLGDLIWFVAIGDALGEELGYRLGRRGQGFTARHARLFPNRAMARARGFFDRFGGAAVLIGRFLPMGSFVAMVAGLVEMRPIRFALWNIAGGFAYALVGLLAGYLGGGVLKSLGATEAGEGLIVVLFLLTIVLIWVLIIHALRVWPFVASVARSAGTAMAENPDVRALAARHPRLVRAFGARLTAQRFTGLPTSLLALALIWMLWLYGGSVMDQLQTGPLTRADRGIFNLIAANRSPLLTGFFSALTRAGYWPVIVTLALGASGLLALAGRRWQAGAIWLVLLGNQAGIEIAKRLFHRPRPEFGLYVEHGYSFPSGHAAVAMAFFGLLAWILARGQGWRVAIGMGLAGTVLIALMGLSRVYLGAHYPSDVLNGFEMGGVWLILGIWLIEARRARDGAQSGRISQPWLRAGLIVATLALAGLAWTQVQPEARAARATAIAGLDVSLEEAFASGQLAPGSESILGVTQQPISLIVLSPDVATFRAVFAKAGWRGADAPNFTNLAHAAFAAWFNQPYPSAPITPSFWQGRPHDMGFQRQTEADSLRQRHHARFWDTNRLSADGQRIFVGTASFDDGLKWGLTHHIAADIDTERDRLVGDLEAAGQVAASRRIRMVAPVLGTNMMGDPFFTGGEAVVLVLDPAPTDPQG